MQNLNNTGLVSVKVCSLISGIPKKTLEGYFQRDFHKKEQEGIRVGEIHLPIKNISKNGYFHVGKLGPRMNIDEKNIGNEVYTILSNPDLGAKGLVGIFPGVQATDIINFIRKFSSDKERRIVKEVSMDMAGTMKNIARNVFTHAIQTVDRFHVMKNVLEDMSALITKHKTDIKKAYLEEQDRAKIERRPPKHQRYGNSETLLELITRGRYQLVQRRSDWNTTQHMRWDCFVLIPELQNITAMYQQIEKVFEIYDDKESTRNTAQTAFHTWFQSISKLDFITELQNTGRMIKHHLERILNYFHSRLTNGYAEGLNSRIQRLVSNSRGFKNLDHMIYRIVTIFG